MVLGTSITMSSCTKDKEDNFVYSPVEASKVVSDLGIESTVVTYNLNGGGGSTPMDAIVLKGSSIELPKADAFGKDGYDFDGWATSFNGTPLEKDKDGKQNYTVNGNVVLYATWKARTVKKALDAETTPETLVIEEENLTEWEFCQLKELVKKGVSQIDLSKTKITEIPDCCFFDMSLIGLNISASEFLEMLQLYSNMGLLGDYNKPNAQKDDILFSTEDNYVFELEEKDDNQKKVLNGTIPLKKVVLPSTIKKIGTFAFCACDIEELSIATTGDTEKDKAIGIEEFGMGAFYYCTKLTKFSLGDKVKKIGSYAFAACSALATEGDAAFVIPENVSVISDYAFAGCKALKKVTSEGAKIVSSFAFVNCSSLAEITFNYNGIDKLRINPYAFQNCSALKTIAYKASQGVDLPNKDNKYWIGFYMDGNDKKEVPAPVEAAKAN